MEYTPTMKPGMAGQGLMKVLALNFSEHIAFFISSHTKSIIFRSSSQVKGRRLNFKREKTFGMDHLKGLIQEAEQSHYNVCHWARDLSKSLKFFLATKEERRLFHC